MITVSTLIAAGVGPTQARLFVEPLLRACSRFDISTAGRMGAFVAQCMVESDGFTRLEENLFYTTPERVRAVFPGSVRSIADAMPLIRNPKALANVVYASRNGNGGAASGDGYKYRGRGLFQITGRTNYLNAGIELGRPYLATPELVATPDDACLSAAWYWGSNHLNGLADAGLSNGITRAINGPGMQQAALRHQRTEEAIRAFS